MDKKPCRNCRRSIPVDNFVLHQAQCERNTIWCSTCDVAVAAANKSEHDSLHELTVCNCGQPVENRFLEQHKLTDCALLEVECIYCDLPIPLKDLADHDDMCGSRTEVCTGCGTYVQLKHLQGHSEDACRRAKEERQDRELAQSLRDQDILSDEGPSDAVRSDSKFSTERRQQTRALLKASGVGIADLDDEDFYISSGTRVRVSRDKSKPKREARRLGGDKKGKGPARGLQSKNDALNVDTSPPLAVGKAASDPTKAKPESKKLLVIPSEAASKTREALAKEALKLIPPRLEEKLIGEAELDLKDMGSAKIDFGDIPVGEDVCISLNLFNTGNTSPVVVSSVSAMSQLSRKGVSIMDNNGRPMPALRGFRIDAESMKKVFFSFRPKTSCDFSVMLSLTVASVVSLKDPKLRAKVSVVGRGLSSREKPKRPPIRSSPTPLDGGPAIIRSYMSPEPPTSDLTASNSNAPTTAANTSTFSKTGAAPMGRRSNVSREDELRSSPPPPTSLQKPPPENICSEAPALKATRSSSNVSRSDAAATIPASGNTRLTNASGAHATESNSGRSLQNLQVSSVGISIRHAQGHPPKPPRKRLTKESVIPPVPHKSGSLKKLAASSQPESSQCPQTHEHTKTNTKAHTQSIPQARTGAHAFSDPHTKTHPPTHGGAEAPDTRLGQPPHESHRHDHSQHIYDPSQHTHGPSEPNTSSRSRSSTLSSLRSNSLHSGTSDPTSPPLGDSSHALVSAIPPPTTDHPMDHIRWEEEVRQARLHEAAHTLNNARAHSLGMSLTQPFDSLARPWSSMEDEDDGK
eukprot:Rmarinus@m.24544